jgi:uncharacterized protein YbcV (DUF1398 family)
MMNMFTIVQIKAAHAKVKSGKDFPQYIQDLIQLGIRSYQTYVTDGHTDYFGDGGYNVVSEPGYAPLVIADAANVAAFTNKLQAHQGGQTDYPTFCSDCADAGVAKWVVDMTEMTCTYYDKAGGAMLVEAIPL